MTVILVCVDTKLGEIKALNTGQCQHFDDKTSPFIGFAMVFRVIVNISCVSESIRLNSALDAKLDI